MADTKQSFDDLLPSNKEYMSVYPEDPGVTSTPGNLLICFVCKEDKFFVLSNDHGHAHIFCTVCKTPYSQFNCGFSHSKIVKV